jgi:hypothetical protein
MFEIRHCQYIKADGSPCESPALRDHSYCYFHRNWREQELRRLLGQEESRFPGELPDLQDPAVIQVAANELMRLMLTDQIDDDRAGLLLYALQTAATDLDPLWYADGP